MSRTFSTKSGSDESLKVSLQCGCRPKARQMREWSTARSQPPWPSSAATSRCHLQGQADRLGDLSIADPARRARLWLVEQPIEAVSDEAAPPLRDCVGVCAHLGVDRLVLQPRRRSQHDLRSTRHRLAGAVCAGEQLQLPPRRCRQLDRHRRLAHRHSPRPASES